jgi:hypothetical protein
MAGENSPISWKNSRFEPLNPQAAQVVDVQFGDLEVHGEALLASDSRLIFSISVEFS